MKCASLESSGPQGKSRGRVRGIEGYLSLALTSLLFVIPLLPILLPSLKEATGLVVLVLVLVLALRGIRSRLSGNRAAAWTSLAIVFVTMLTTIVIACTEFHRLMSENHRLD
jgi:ABC-type spermidine/putrescine transport system permease subunit II